MSQYRLLPYFIITTFLLVEQNQLTQMNSQSQQNSAGNHFDQCAWPPQPISAYFRPRHKDFPICHKNELPFSSRTLDHLDPEKATTPVPTEQGSGDQQDPGLDYPETDFLKIIEKPEEPPAPPTEPPPPAKPAEKAEDDGNKSAAEDSIPSFSEWTKLQLAQRQETIINNINKNKTLPHQEGKNFASPVCGAKIRNNNPEAQNPGGIISSSNDEYMLNRCTSTIWFIIELCEPLQIEKVALGNLELFASNPHEIDLEISARYPSREWHLLGTFHAPDIRNVHSLILPQSSNSTFGKFLRVSVRSHHGSEHYCPLSLIRVYGKSEYEVLESETASGADSDDQHGADYVGTSTYEEELTFSNRPATKSVFGAAKEAVIDMVKKAVNVLGNGNKSTSSGTAEPSLIVNNSSDCMSLIQCVEETNSSFHDAVVLTLACKSHLMNWMTKYLKWCGWEHCHTVFNSYSVGTPSMPEGFLAAIYGPSVLESLCHFLQPLKSCSSVNGIISGNKTSTGDDPMFELATGVPNTTLPPGAPEIEETKNGDVNGKTAEKKETVQNSNGNGAKSIPLTPVEKKPDVPPETMPLPHTKIPLPPVEIPSSLPAEQGQSNSKPSDNGEQIQKSEQKQKDQQGSQAEPTPSSFIIIEPPASASAPSPPTTPDEQYSPGAFQQNKESVFVRLSNRIKALEINQSLSSGYLEELSRRFKKQNEDINHSHELFRNLLNESMRRTKWLENSFRYEIRKLTRNIENLREIIYKVEVQRSGLVIFGLCQLICTVIIFYRQATTPVPTCCCKPAHSTGAGAPVKASSNTAGSNSQPNTEVLFRKRSNSEQFLKKVSKKKRRKELLRGNDDVFTFKTPAIIKHNSTSTSATAAALAMNDQPNSTQLAVNKIVSQNSGNAPGANANRVYPAVNNSGSSVPVPPNGMKKPSSGESQNGPKVTTSASMTEKVSGTGGNISKSESANSLDAIKAGKSKSSKSFAFWK